MVFAFFMRPVFPFALEFLLVAPLVLGADHPGMGPLYLFLLPWLLLVLGVLNLPLVMQAFRLFKMDLRTRRNHALEHATIHFLRAEGGSGIGGRASSDGFRISGGGSPPDIQAAFEEVRRLIRQQLPLPHVSRNCGSNRITALALAVCLLAGVAAATLIARPPLGLRAVALAGVVLVFMMMRHVIGNWVQARYFMATDFSEVSIASVRKVKAGLVEAPPVYFVETTVR